jgi:pimeloyl-ACP methyl ester carboxylesterase
MASVACVAAALLWTAADPSPPPGRLVDVNGVKLWFESHGKGAPVVLLHGGVNTFETTFGKLTPSLASRYRVIGVEQVGHGHSPDVDRPYGYEQMADDTAALLASQGIGPADLVGWSDGGIVALLIARRHPERVRRVAVSGVNIRVDGITPGFAKWARSVSPDDPLLAAVREAYGKVSPDGAAHWPFLVKRDAALWLTPVILDRDELAGIAAPSLVISGDRDSVTLEHTMEVFRTLPNAQLSVLPGTGHVTFGPRADWVLPQLTSFLDAPDKPSAVGIASVTEGKGTPLFVVHGGWGDLRSFSRAVPILSERSTVTRVSLRLHWPNPWPASEKEAYDGYLIENHAADLVKAIERSGRVPVDLLGHSYGGVVAVVLARSRPDLVRRLILVEPSLYGLLRGRADGEKFISDEAKWRDGLLARIRSGEDPLAVLRGMYDGARPGTFDAFPEWRRQILIDNARTLGPVLTHNWVDFPFACKDAASLRMPVLIVEGEKTDADMREIDSVLAGCLSDARRVVLPNAKHTIQFDAPEALARAVAEFVVR